MNERRNMKGHALLFGAAGWLFADLLLALAMLFMVANSVGSVAPPPTPMPTATFTPTPSPTPTPPVPVVETSWVSVLVTNVSYLDIVAGARNNNPSAFGTVEQQLQDKGQLQDATHAGHCAAIVVIYGGGQGVSGSLPFQIALAFGAAPNVAVGDPVYPATLLPDLGKHWQMFSQAHYYSALEALGNPPDTVQLDIFMYDHCPSNS